MAKINKALELTVNRVFIYTKQKKLMLSNSFFYTILSAQEEEAKASGLALKAKPIPKI